MKRDLSKSRSHRSASRTELSWISRRMPPSIGLWNYTTRGSIWKKLRRPRKRSWTELRNKALCSLPQSRKFYQKTKWMSRSTRATKFSVISLLKAHRFKTTKEGASISRLWLDRSTWERSLSTLKTTFKTIRVTRKLIRLCPSSPSPKPRSSISNWWL